MGDKGSKPATNVFDLEDNWLARAFLVVIETRWPSSFLLPQQPTESIAEYLVRQQMFQRHYTEFTKLCWKLLVAVDSADAQMPYTMLCQPDNAVRLKYPINVPLDGKNYPPNIFGGKPIIQLARIINLQLNSYINQKKPYSDQLGDEIKLAFSPFGVQTDKRNVLQKVEEDEKELDPDKLRQEFYDWFTEVWPICNRAHGYFNQFPQDFEREEYIRRQQYETWVEDNFKACFSRKPENGYDSWPAPYFTDNGQQKDRHKYLNAPPPLCLLGDGNYRSGLLFREYGILTHDDWNNFRHRYALKPISWWKSKTNVLFHGTPTREKPTLSLDPEDDSILDVPAEERVFMRRIWGSNGLLQAIYPPNWPKPLRPVFENKSYPGCYAFWPLPMFMVNASYCKIPYSFEMNEPTSQILAYWAKLIDLFRTKNPTLVLPWLYQDMTSGEEANKGRPYGYTDRPGYKVEGRSYFPDATTMNTNNTSQLLILEQQLNEEFRRERDLFFYTHAGDFLKWSGLDPQLGNVYDEYPPFGQWRSAIIMGWHLRLAERHYFKPWEIFNDIREKPDNTIIQKIEDALAENQINVDWIAMTWGDQVISRKQATAITKPNFPFPEKHLSRENELMLWKNMYDLFYFYQNWIKKNGSSVPIEVNTIPRHLYNNVATFLYHRVEHIFPDQWEDPMEDFCLTIGNLINETSSPATWYRVIQYYSMKFYQEVIVNSKILIRRLGQCQIDPLKPLEESCIPISEVNYGLNNSLSVVENVWIMWRKQWDVTRDYNAWPKYRINADSSVTLVEEAKPLPSFFEKYWATITSWFKGKFPNLGKGEFLADPAENLMPGNIGGGTGYIQGFILPSGAVRSDRDLQNLYDFVQRNPMPIIQKRPDLLSTGQYQDMIDKQWVAYRDWVESNIKASTALYYRPPNQQILDKDGVRVFHKTDPAKPVMNRMPTFGVFPTTDIDNFNWIFSIGTWPENLTGVDSWLALAYAAAKVVVDALVALVAVLPEILPGLLLIAGVIAGIGLVYSYVTKEPKVKAIEVAPANIT